MHRRDLFKYSAAAGLAAAFPTLGWSEGGEGGPLEWDRSLVIIELRGGNDGLNTVIPYEHPVYRDLRPNLAVPAEEVLKMEGQLPMPLGFHPTCTGLKEVWDEGQLAIFQGLGYRRPNRSHFRGIDIWNGGTGRKEIAHDGWMARVLDDVRGDAPSDLLADAVVWGLRSTVAHGGLGPLFGRKIKLLVMDSVDDFLRRGRGIEKLDTEPLNPAHELLIRSQNDVHDTIAKFEEFQRNKPNVKGDFPRHHLGKFLKRTAEMVGAGLKVPVYKLTIQGFDTHSGQRGKHDRPLTAVSDGIAASREACIANDCWDRVAVMTYSEFGRRAAGNDSGGTDHGTAAPHFLTGGAIRGGLYGDHPDLDNLRYNDLVHTQDYRNLYETVVRGWMGYRGEYLDGRFEAHDCFAFEVDAAEGGKKKRRRGGLLP